MVQQLERDQLKIQGLFRRVRVKTLAETDLRKIDPDLISFFNINTPEDLLRAETYYQASVEEPQQP
jgi:molybdopterin-guanine dinucleotide biosynthesis protein A